MKKLLLGVFILTVLIAGCTALAHQKALQTPGMPKSPPIALPSATPSIAQAPKGTFQRGIDIDAYTYPGQNIPAAAAADVAFIRSLHANAVLISFPFFMSGPASRAVYASAATPTPQQLAVIISTARQAGLYVSVRPLLDETNLGRSRVGWIPPHLPAWFASYRRLLVPYAAAAQRAGAREFIVGTEFTAFPTAAGWVRLDRAVRHHFHGVLACANNHGEPITAGNCGPGLIQTVDAYQPQQPPLIRGWEAYDRTLPPRTVETEVGIDAVRGAFADPPRHQWPTATLDPQVQARWFTAACRAAAIEHLGGIYFWSIGLSSQPASGPTLKYQGGWAGGAGAQAISSCFKVLAKGHKWPR